jgi:hypothetical protein
MRLSDKLAFGVGIWGFRGCLAVRKCLGVHFTFGEKT